MNMWLDAAKLTTPSKYIMSLILALTCFNNLLLLLLLTLYSIAHPIFKVFWILTWESKIKFWMMQRFSNKEYFK